MRYRQTRKLLNGRTMREPAWEEHGASHDAVVGGFLEGNFSNRRLRQSACPRLPFKSVPCTPDGVVHYTPSIWLLTPSVVGLVSHPRIDPCPRRRYCVTTCQTPPLPSPPLSPAFLSSL